MVFLLAIVGCVEEPRERVPRPEPTLGTTPIPPLVDTDTDSGPTEPPPYEMSGFSFVDDTLAGMPQPGGRAPLATDLAFLVEQEIVLLVSLTEEPTDPLAVADAGLEMLHLPIVDFTPPTLDQQIAFVDATRAKADLGLRVGVHDTAGYGRCGTMLATWFVAEGMDAETAMAEIRRLRPGSIETDEQEQSVRDYAASLGL